MSPDKTAVYGHNSNTLQYILQEETMSKTGRCSAGQSQSTWQAQVGQQISSPEPDSTDQSQPERASEDHTSTHLSAAYRSWEHEQFLQKCTRQWKTLRRSIVSVQWFLFWKREILCPGTCAVPFFYHLTCVGAYDFSPFSYFCIWMYSICVGWSILSTLICNLCSIFASVFVVELLFLIVTWIQQLYCWRPAFNISLQYCKPMFTLHQNFIRWPASVMTDTNEMCEILTGISLVYLLCIFWSNMCREIT